jgi:hypothetical protein
LRRFNQKSGIATEKIPSGVTIVLTVFRESKIWWIAELTPGRPYPSPGRAEDGVDQVGNPILREWRVRHQSTKEDGAEQRESRDLRVDPRGKSPVATPWAINAIVGLCASAWKW